MYAFIMIQRYVNRGRRDVNRGQQEVNRGQRVVIRGQRVVNRAAFARICLVVAGCTTLALLSPSASFGQTGVIAGTVSDTSGAPLPGVNVAILESSRGAASRADGTYRIDDVPVGRHTIVASAVGFERTTRTVEISEGEDVRVDFVLREIAIQSGELVVTASRRERLTGGVAASVSTVTPEQISSRNAVALDDALRYVSGVQMAGNQINVRGSSGFSYNTGSRVLLLLDGSPMLRPDVNGIPYDAIPMSQVRRIEVLKGPGSALYGGGALGGVINVITRDYPDRPETAVDVFGGAYQPVRYEAWRSRWEDGDRPQPMAGISVGHARPLGKRSGVWTHVAYRYDAGHLRLDTRRNLQVFSKITAGLFGDARLRVLGGWTRRTSDNFLFWNGLEDPLNPGRIDFGREAGSSGSDDNLINELSLLPSYVDAVGSELLITARGRIFGVIIQPLDEEGNPRPISRGTTGLRYGGELQADYSPSSSRTITLGAIADANAASSSFFEEAGDISQPEIGGFFQWEESGIPGLTVAAGARFDAYRIRAGQVTSKLSPKLSASYALNDRMIVRGAFAEGFRVPSVLERFVSSTTYLPLVSNIDLRPETSRSYEVGLRAFPLLSGLSTTVDGAAFWSDYWELIEPTFVPAERAFQFVNLTRARIRGVEITGTITHPNERSTLQLGYTYLDARDLTMDRPLVFRSSHLLQLGATATFSGVRLGADFRYASRPDRVDSDFATFVKDAEKMVAIRVLDLRIGRTFGRLDATIHLKNALDYYYVERPAILAPPRHVILQLSTRL